MIIFKTIKKSIVSFASVLLLANCQHPQVAPEKKIITIKGSDSELNLLNFFSNQYKANRPDVAINITGGGTTHGIMALINHETDIAIASRVITEEELKKAKEKGVTPIPFIMAQDIIAIVTNPETGVDSLSLDQVSKIFSGEILNWKELGGANLPIKLFGRDKNSGTRYYLKDKLSIKKFAQNYVEVGTNLEIINKINVEKGAIGFVNVGSIVDENGKPSNKVWAVNLYIDKNAACSPYEKQRVKYGEYPLVRPLIQYTNGKPTGRLLEFINFELLEKQQQDLEKHGYLKINATYFNMNQTSLN